jgi:hypothetical protein
VVTRRANAGVAGLVEPEVHSPAGIGNALYVFALPDRR